MRQMPQSGRRFQSTHPVWGATPGIPHPGREPAISIHAPRVGCDVANPRQRRCAEFQSTHPVWGATQSRRSRPCRMWYFNPRTPCGVRLSMMSWLRSDSSISIHAPRVGCDETAAPTVNSLSKFQSTHPVWGATHFSAWAWACSLYFNPRTPCGVRPRRWWGHSGRWWISIHAPRVGCDSGRSRWTCRES